MCIVLLQCPGEPTPPVSPTSMRQQSIPKAQMTFFVIQFREECIECASLVKYWLTEVDISNDLCQALCLPGVLIRLL